MAEEKKNEIKEIVTKEPIPDYFLKFLLQYAESNGEKYTGLVPVRISIEHIVPEVCANKSAAPSEIRVLYKCKDWVDKHKGGKDA